MSFVMIVVTHDRARLCRARVAKVCNKLDGVFVEASERSVWVVRFLIECEHVFHVVDELGALVRRNHQLFGSVWLEFVL